MSKFQDRLRKLKDESGKTQAAIANELGLTQQNFSYYINGREPDYDILVQIAQYFDVSADYLLGITNFRHPAGNSYDEIGLFEETANVLKKMHHSESGYLLIFANALVCDEEFPNLLKNIGLYMKPDDFFLNLAVSIDRLPNSLLSFSTTTGVEFLKAAISNEAVQLFKNILDKMRKDLEEHNKDRNNYSKKAPPKRD